MHRRLYQVRSNSEKLLLRMRTQGKEFFFHTGAAEMSSSHVAGHIQDDTDLTPLWITIDHASETLQYGSQARDLNRNAYRFERTQLDVRFTGVDYGYALASFQETCGFADLLN
jgi:hypothetical protein